jgi:putative ABC transport system permease protein
VVYSQSIEGQIATVLSTNIDAGALTVVEDALRDDPNVDGIMPGLIELVPVLHAAAGRAEPGGGLTGWDPARIGQFGNLLDPDGNVIDLAALPPGAVVLSETGAENLSATVGDTLIVYFNNQPHEVTVAALAPDTALSGVVNPNMSGMAMALDELQTLTNQPGVLSMIVISNAGGVRDGLAATDAVVEKLEPALAGTGLGYQALKQELGDQSEENAEIFSSLFLVMGLFSIAAGILLIVLTFTMLAAERRSEMGIDRAVGAHRM